MVTIAQLILMTAAEVTAGTAANAAYLNPTPGTPVSAATATHTNQVYYSQDILRHTDTFMPLQVHA